jgi:hypothetical protein
MTRVAVKARADFLRMQLVATASCLIVVVLCVVVPTSSDTVRTLRLITVPFALLGALLFVVTWRRFSRRPAFELDEGKIILRKGPFITLRHDAPGAIAAAAEGGGTRVSWPGGSLLIDGRLVAPADLTTALGAAATTPAGA